MYGTKKHYCGRCQTMKLRHLVFNETSEKNHKALDLAITAANGDMSNPVVQQGQFC